jgi:hypothetical protein
MKYNRGRKRKVDGGKGISKKFASPVSIIGNYTKK